MAGLGADIKILSDVASSIAAFKLDLHASVFSSVDSFDKLVWKIIWLYQLS